MAGCSIIMLMLVLWPFMLVGTVVTIAFVAAVEFVTSPAFIFLVASVIFGALAAADVIRILWRRHREGPSYELNLRTFMRPLVLCGMSMALFLVMVLLTGGMLLAWYQEMRAR